MGLQIYGNHCGPGHGRPEDPAVDQLDEACKRHDAGYAEHGYFDFGSDRKLIEQQVDLIESGQLDAGQTLLAAGIVGVFTALLPVSATVSAVRGFGNPSKLFA